MKEDAQLARKESPLSAELSLNSKLLERLSMSVDALGGKLNPVLSPPSLTDSEPADERPPQSEVVNSLYNNNRRLVSLIEAINQITDRAEV